MNDDLIERLVGDMRPVGRHAVLLRLLAGLAPATVVAGIALVLWLGLRPDLPAAFADPVFWTKLGYTLVLFALGLAATNRLSRPAASGRRPLQLLPVAFGLALLVGVVQLAVTPPEAWRVLFIGGTALVCPFYIATLSLPILAAGLLVVRHLAPTRLTRAGLAVGLMAGGAGAAVYSFHCGENGLVFLALWYTLGVLISGALGALLGRLALRW